MGPGGREGCWRGEGGRGTSVGLGQPCLAGSQRSRRGQRDKRAWTHVRAPEVPAWPWSLPLLTASTRGSPEVGGGVADAKALGEVASSFKYPLGQPPCCLDGNHYCFRGTGKGHPPTPWLVLESHLRQPGGPGGGWEALSAPLASQLGSKPSLEIKKHFGEVTSARGGAGSGSGRRCQRALWSLIKAVLSPRPSSSSESDGHSSCQASGGSPL